MPAKLDAILWDFDGTLVNSNQKNIDTTKSILSIVVPHLSGENLPGFLRSESAYHEANHAVDNWRGLYRDFCGLTEREIDQAGSLWAEHQEKNGTQVPLFDGIDEVINRFCDVPHGICSQNARQNIWDVLKLYRIDAPFRAVVGYDDLTGDTQKPHAAGGIMALADILGNTTDRCVMYIGDHEADVRFARNIQSTTGDGTRVIAVAVAYSGARPDRWSVKADHVANRVSELGSIIGQYT